MDEKITPTTEATQAKPAFEAKPAPAGIDARVFVTNVAEAYRKADGNVHVQSDCTVKAAKAIAGMANKADAMASTDHFLAQTGVSPDLFASEIQKAQDAAKV